MKLSYASAAAAVLALGAFGCGKKEAADTSIVTVNGEAISTKEYMDLLDHKSTVLVSTPQGPQLAQTVNPVGFQALQDLVNRKLLLQVAKEQNVLPTNADVDKELNFRTEQQGDYVTLMTQEAGLTLEQLKNDILFDLARERLITKGIVVSPTEVDTFIKENPQQFMEPAKANILIVAVSDAKKKAQVDKALASGTAFQNVATSYSEIQNARETNGQFPITVVDQMPPQLKTLVEKTPALKASDWTTAGPTSFKIYVQSKTPAKKMDMTPARKDVLRRQLAMQRGQLANDLTKRTLDKLKTSKIEVSSGYLNKLWGKYMDTVKKDTAAPTTPPAGGTPTPGAPVTPAPTAPKTN